MTLAHSDGIRTTDIIRPGSRRDAGLVTRLLDTGRRIYCTLDPDQIAHWPEQTMSLLWLRGQTLLGAVIWDRVYQFTGTVRLFAIRYSDDQPLFLRHVIPRAERLLTHSRIVWSSLESPNDWLMKCLTAVGYVLHSRLVLYQKVGASLPPSHLHASSLLTRQAKSSDLAGVLELDGQIFDPLWQLDSRFLRDAIGQGYHIQVAERDGHVVGYLIAQRQGAAAQITRLGVAPSHRDCGIGSLLVANIITLLAQQGVSSFWLNTQAENHAARHLYESLGFGLLDEPYELWVKNLVMGASSF